MKRMVLLPLLLLLISAWLPFHSVHANERKTIATGVYQVELSFLSSEDADTDVLFNKQATLTVKEDRYTLSIAAKNDHILTYITAAQQGEKTSTRLDRSENLVQFDIKDIQKKIELTGTYRLAQEHAQQSFSYEVLIGQQSLPAINQNRPAQSIQPGEDTVHYQLLSEGKASAMSDYVNPVIRVIKRDKRYYAQLEIFHPKKVQGFTVEQQGDLVEPKLVSQANTRVVQFEVEDFEKGTRVWMKAENLEKPYVQEEFLQIVFDQQQVAKLLNKLSTSNKAVSSLTKRAEQPAVSIPDNETTVIKKEEKVEESSEEKDQALVDLPPLLPEEQLEFDRTVDDVKKEPKQEVAQIASEPKELAISGDPVEQTIPFDMLKIGVLLSLCILSGILLIRRLTKKNNATGNE